jgi:hypothetical protein
MPRPHSVTAEGVEELVLAVRAAQRPDSDEVLPELGPSAIFERVRVEAFEAFPSTRTGTAKTDRNALRRLVFPPG